MADDVQRHLRRHVAAGKDALLFSRPDGTHLPHNTFGNQWRKARRAAGRDDLHFHDLRHTALTAWAKNHATLGELLALAGHEDSKIAMRYQQATRDRLREVATGL